MPDEDDWIELDERGKVADGGSLRYGVYRIQIYEGQEVLIPGEIELCLSSVGWCWPDGTEYGEPVSHMLRCKRVGDPPP